MELKNIAMRCVAIFVICFVSCQSGVCAEWDPVNKTLVSVEQNLRVKDWTYQTTTPDGQIISVVKSVLHGGKQEGVDIVTIDNGRLAMVVVPSRGMSILGVTMGSLRLGWDSPVREVVHPAHINLHDRGGLGWLDGFNEWLVRCGLEFAGHPGTDTFKDNTGSDAEQVLTLHGKIGNIPASEVKVWIDKEPPYEIHLQGRGHERSFYGAALELDTEITTQPGSNRFTLNDGITNQGAQPQEYEIIYHANFGRPILEADASVMVPLRRLQPMNAAAKKNLNRFDRFSGPTLGEKENVFLIEPLSDADGDTTVLIQNADKTLGCSMHYSVDSLPFLTVWTNLAAERSGYVVGIEPGTNYPFNRRLERKAGRLKKLGPGVTRKFELTYTLLDDAQAIERVSDSIRDVSDGFSPEIVPDPPPVK